MNFLEVENIWQFVGGLGIFLLSMKFIEESLIHLAGRRFKQFFREYTKTPLRGILSGTLATAVLQSSSVVTLMVLSFVGAGVLEMRSALGVVFGSNLGTTFTGWMVAAFGFKVNVQEFAFPLIGLGSLFYTFFPNEKKLSQIFRFLAGLGLLFLGLEFMKLAMESVSQKFDVSLLHGYGISSYFIFGCIFTAIIQSSSATMMITLAALNSGVVTLTGAAALIIGADLGTTATALLASIGSSPGKRQTSMAHFLFNLVTDLMALSLIKPLLYFVFLIFGQREPLFSLVFFHSTFNFIGVLIFLPFTKYFAYFLEKYIGRTEKELTSFIHRVNPHMSEAATVALFNEVSRLFDRVLDCNLSAYSINHSKKNFSSIYEELKEQISEILSYALAVQGEQVNESDSKRLSQLLRAIDNLSKSIKSAKDIHHNFEFFQESAQNEIIQFHDLLIESIKKRYQIIKEIKLFENQSHIFEELVALKKLNIQEYQDKQKIIYDYLRDKKLTESEIATLLNVNREIHSSTESIVLALSALVPTTFYGSIASAKGSRHPS